MSQAEAETRPQNVQVVVYAPKDVEPKHFTFRAAELVGAAAKTAAAQFGVQSNNPSFQDLETKDVLDRNQTLEGAGVDNGDKLELVDVGGGV